MPSLPLPFNLLVTVQRHKLCFPVQIHYILTIYFFKFADMSSQASQGTTGHQVDEPIKSFRTHFTAYQRRELEKTFSQSQYISPQKRQSLSLQLGISNEIIQVHLLVGFQFPVCVKGRCRTFFLNTNNNFKQLVSIPQYDRA